MTSATSLKELQDSALEHLWVYLREPSDMAEKGEPTVYVSGEGRAGDRCPRQHVHRRHVGAVAQEHRLRPQGSSRRGLRADAQADLHAPWAPPPSRPSRLGREGGRDYARRPFPLFLHQRRLRSRWKTAIKLSRAYFKRGGRAGPHQVHQPQGTPTTAPPQGRWPWAATTSTPAPTTSR